MTAPTAGAGAVAVSAQSPEVVSVLGRHALAQVDQRSGPGHATYHRWMEVVIGGALGGLPVANLPDGVDGRGRPMGMQFMGRMGHDRKVLEFAMANEATTDFLDQQPVLTESV